MVTLSLEVVEESIRRFVTEVKRQHNVQAIYLFGSHVTGNTQKWSDIDLLVVSPDFRATRLEARLGLMRIARHIDDRIEPHPLAPEDFNINNQLAYEVQRAGVRISIDA